LRGRIVTHQDSCQTGYQILLEELLKFFGNLCFDLLGDLSTIDDPGFHRRGDVSSKADG